MIIPEIAPKRPTPPATIEHAIPKWDRVLGEVSGWLDGWKAGGGASRPPPIAKPGLV